MKEHCTKCKRPIEGDRLGEIIDGNLQCQDIARCSKPYVIHTSGATLKPMKGFGALDGKLMKIIVGNDQMKAVAFAVELPNGKKEIICPSCGRSGENPSIEWERIRGFVYHADCTIDGMTDKELMQFWLDHAPADDINRSLFNEILPNK